MNKYLLEIGTEELPYEFIPVAIERLRYEFSKALEENKISLSDIKMYSTPRRLALVLEGLPQKQEDIKKTIKGPISNIALDSDGNYTQAAQGFAKKNNIETKDLFVQDNYIWANIEQKGKLTKDILQEIAPDAILKLRGSHFMRWADFDVKFQRPIRWIVSIFNNEQVPIEINEVKSSNTSRGHRFADEKTVVINSPDEYKNTLLKVKVIVDSEERKREIIKRSQEEAQKNNAFLSSENKDLLKEVNNLVEWPVPVVCSFAEKYLDIPPKVTVTVMETHQRYFALYADDKKEKLLNKFITISNYLGNDFENITRGNERVVTARLEDAIFFYNEDKNKGIYEYAKELNGMTFQKGFGSMEDKTERIIKLSGYLCDELKISNEDKQNINKTAQLCKADLATKLVFEFTELQGYIGGQYAKLAGENPRVVKGIEEHYYPINAESEISKNIEGQIVGIADKIDTITAAFADGKKITGSQDPLGIRRATLGLLKTIMDGNLSINLNNLIKQSIQLMPVKIDNKEELFSTIQDFFLQRLMNLCDSRVEYDIVKACVNEKILDNGLIDLKSKIDDVHAFIYSVNVPRTEFLEAINRIINITKNSTDTSKVDSSLLVQQEEQDLYNSLNDIKSEHNNYHNYLSELNDKIIQPITKFFDNVLVMDKDEKIKQNRINLLLEVREKFDIVADFSQIVY